MMGLLRLVLVGIAGAVLLRSLPRLGVLASTQEIIAFLSLIMAGLLPAMILTATILRGSGLSAKRVEEYGLALQAQLRFWSMLFVAAAASTLGITVAKIFSTAGVSFDVAIGQHHLDAPLVSGLSLWMAGAGLGIVVMRMRAAFVGLVSLLDLNIKMSKTEALAHDRSLLTALEADTRLVAGARPYEFSGHEQDGTQ